LKSPHVAAVRPILGRLLLVVFYAINIRRLQRRGRVLSVATIVGHNRHQYIIDPEGIKCL